jgi:hypothetical protein
MKTHCLFCDQPFDAKQGSVCPSCHQDNSLKALNPDQTHLLHQNCHNQIRKQTEKKNSGLTFLVIGGILLIVGLLFLVLSFRFNVKKQRVFTPGSVEFVICVLSLSLSVFSLVFGSIRLILSQLGLRKYRKILKDTEL